MTNKSNKTRILSVRFTPEEYTLLALAKPSGVDISKYARSVLLENVVKGAERALEDCRREYVEQGRPETPIPSSPVVSKNRPCPCGSGKKYKKCCGKEAMEQVVR
jgi:uncharacterized protein YecA (UPF0149 family)